MTELGLALFEGEPKPEDAINLHIANAIAHAEGLNAKAKERIDRAFELLKAETEGRLIVLPCNVGDDVWVLRGDERPGGYVTLTPTHVEKYEHGFSVGMLGNDFKLKRPFFLAREEAEKALEDTK